jgi:hypothetical protein
MAGALQRNFDLSIPRKGTGRPHSQFPNSFVFERFIYFQGRSTYFPAAEYADRSWEYINRTQKHKRRNWDCGRAVPFLGKYVSSFRYSIFVYPSQYKSPQLEQLSWVRHRIELMLFGLRLLVVAAHHTIPDSRTVLYMCKGTIQGSDCYVQDLHCFDRTSHCKLTGFFSIKNDVFYHL